MQDNQRVNNTVHIGQLLPQELQNPVSFDDVQLDDAELQAAITEGRKKKQAEMEYNRQKLIAEAMEKDMRRPWTPNELYEYARKRATLIIRAESGNPNAVFEPMPHQQPVIRALALYFSGSPDFENLDEKIYNNNGLKFSLTKGIWLWGVPGVGKTLMMQMFSKNRRLCYDVVQCPKLVFGYIKNGDDHINPYGKIIRESEDALSFYQTQKGVCYNDLGVETSPAKHYGTPINVMESVFLDAYENKIPFWHRHVTTNLTIDQLKETYGERFTDRMKQCFNILDVKGKSLRK